MTATVQIPMTHATPIATGEQRTGGIAVGVDGSPSALIAALWAAAEAHRLGVPLALVHAAHLPDGPTTPVLPFDHTQHRLSGGRVLLSQTAADITARYPELPVTTELCHLSPAHSLEALSHKSSLLVVGTRGHGGFVRARIGSVTRELAARAHCPLVVVPSRTPRDPAGDVVLGVGPGHTGAAIRYAFEAARSRHASLTAVRTWWPVTTITGRNEAGALYVDGAEIFRETAAEDVEEAIAPSRAQFSDVPVRTVISQGNTVDVLLDTARRGQLLVVGAHRPRGPLSTGAGYVIDGVIAYSPIPVAVIPALM